MGPRFRSAQATSELASKAYASPVPAFYCSGPDSGFRLSQKPAAYFC